MRALFVQGICPPWNELISNAVRPWFPTMRCCAACFCGTTSAVSPSGGGLVALLGAVDGGASDTEQVGEFGGAVFTGLEQADQMCFLPGVELGLLAAEPTLGLRYRHPFSGAQPDQVGLELRDHGHHVEQQPADRVVRIVDRGAETETDLPGGEFVGDPARRAATGRGGRAWSPPGCRLLGRPPSPPAGRAGLGWCRSGRDRRRSWPARPPVRSGRLVAVRSCWSVEQRA